ncbi:glycoside hydrolase [Corynespora cassiicola Philippines]|uniref:Trehalase n=1 Tax=Corynespora cassiicola Philippines TaxID=1448308 RepID=A0A2T2NUR0_CORCC|nr:glycoside hydrolase [Corynespora cassiicola Philippines]
MAAYKLRRTQSQLNHLGMTVNSEASRVHRRGSHDNLSAIPITYLVEVEATLETLMQREDTDEDEQITIDDDGFKVLRLRTLSSGGFKSADVRGNYPLSNLLQELVRKKEGEQKWDIVPHASLLENPVTRLRRLIKHLFWDNLTRTLDATSIHVAAPDPKDHTAHPQPRIYVPQGAPSQLTYYKKVAEKNPELNLDVQLIPSAITDDVYRCIIKKPGLLALEMEETVDEATGQKNLRGVPFVVPGGCFNELYNWDSYFITLGLLDDDKIELARDLVSNFIFEIQHYGMIPNASRSYYLLRSQPPFLTDLALRIYDRLPNKYDPRSQIFIRRALLAAIKEYHTVWTQAPRLDASTGLSRYRPAGVASPPECKLAHFAEIFRPFAEKHGMGHDLGEFRKQYDAGQINEPELDEYFLHDRGVRESGHDVSLRVEGVCADLATIDLNCLLYKYEKDIAHIIRKMFQNSVEISDEFFATNMPRVQTSEYWDHLADKRKKAIDQYLWNDEKGLYLDYNTARHEQTSFETVTCLWALWCGVASPYQAARLVAGLSKFERPGGLLSTNVDLRGTTRCHDAHQWDYPHGWAPHQIMAWDGLHKYGYSVEAERLAYKWLFLVTKIFTEYNGTVVEKYDVTQLSDSHKVNFDYGNQGLGFKGYAKEGFAWTNASYVYGFNFLTSHAKRALGVLAPWETYSEAKNHSNRHTRMTNEI